MTAWSSTIFNRLEENDATQSNCCAQDRSRGVQPQPSGGGIVAGPGVAYARGADQACARADHVAQYRHEVSNDGSRCERLRAQSHKSAAHARRKASQKVREVRMPR